MGSHTTSCALAKLEPFLKAQNEHLQAHDAALEHLNQKNLILEGSLTAIREALDPAANLVEDDAMALTTDGEPVDLTIHNLLCLHESLRDEVSRVSMAISELDAKSSMVVTNEQLRVKEEFAHANSAIGGLRMQLDWLTRTSLQTQQKMATAQGHSIGSLEAAPSKYVQTTKRD